MDSTAFEILAQPNKRGRPKLYETKIRRPQGGRTWCESNDCGWVLLGNRAAENGGRSEGVY